MIIRVFTNITSPTECSRLDYTLKYISSHPLTPADVSIHMNTGATPDLILNYGANIGKADFTMPAQRYFFGETVRNQYVLNSLSDQNKIFAVESSANEDRSPVLDSKFTFDLFESIFFHISRYEEIHAQPQDLNAERWLDEEKHLSVKEGVEQLPLADYLVSYFLQVVLGRAIHCQTTYLISHDIDILQKFPNRKKVLRSMLGHIYYGRPFKYVFNSLRHWRKMQQGKERDPYDTFDFLLRASPKWQQKKLFVMTGGDSPHEGHYQVQNIVSPSWLRLAQDRGYEIGLHPSYEAAVQPELFAAEINKLNGYIKRDTTTSRQHFLRFDWSITPNILSTHGILEDHSLGYNRHLGFRCGTGFSYHLYNFATENTYPWKEQPFAYMESSLINYCLDHALPIRATGQNFITKHHQNTCLSFNVHNSNFDPLVPHGPIIRQHYLADIIAPIEKD